VPAREEIQTERGTRFDCSWCVSTVRDNGDGDAIENIELLELSRR
jgi:hypothetical protein